MYTQLLPTNKGFKPRLNDGDNKGSRTSQAYIEGNDAKIQLVESHSHWANAAKRLLKPQKSLCCQFINGRPDLTHSALEQSTCTSTWHVEYVTFLQQQNNISIWCVKELFHFWSHTSYSTRHKSHCVWWSWQAHKLGWTRQWCMVCGPQKHYQCYKFHMPDTQAYRIAYAEVFYPTHSNHHIPVPWTPLKWQHKTSSMHYENPLPPHQSTYNHHTMHIVRSCCKFWFYSRANFWVWGCITFKFSWHWQHCVMSARPPIWHVSCWHAGVMVTRHEMCQRHEQCHDLPKMTLGNIWPNTLA